MADSEQFHQANQITQDRISFCHEASEAVVARVAVKVERVQRRKVLEHKREAYGSGRALVRYIQLNRQCSETAAYQRIAIFIKQHMPFDDPSSIERMVAYDRPGLLAIAQRLLVHDSDAIDKM